MKLGARSLGESRPPPSLSGLGVGASLRTPGHERMEKSQVGLVSRREQRAHEIRVGIRRARTARRELGPLCPVAGTDWETPFAEAFRALGEYRDRHTVVAALQARLAVIRPMMTV